METVTNFFLSLFFLHLFCSQIFLLLDDNKKKPRINLVEVEKGSNFIGEPFWRQFYAIVPRYKPRYQRTLDYRTAR